MSARAGVVAKLPEHFETGHIGQFQIQDHAIDELAAQYFQRLAAAARGDDVQIVMAEQLRDAELLGGVVLHDKKLLAARLDEGFEP